MPIRYRWTRLVGVLAALVLVAAALAVGQQWWKIYQRTSAGERHLLYVKGVREPVPSTVPAVHRYEVYRVGRDLQPDYQFSISGVSQAPAGRVVLLRRTRQVLANLGTSLEAFAFATTWNFRIEFPVWGMRENGPGKRQVRYTAPAGFTIEGFAVRSDERLLVFTEYRQQAGAPPQYRIKRLDLEHGTVTNLWSSEQGTQGVRGAPAPRVWLKGEDAIFFQGITFSDNCCSYARINEDGSGFMPVDLPYGLPSRDGVWFASNGHTGSGVGCYTPRHTALVYDLATLQPTTVFADPERAVEVLGWSLDSTLLLYSTSALGPSSRPGCGPEPDPASTRYAVADLVRGGIQDIAPDDERILAWRFPGSVEGVVVRCADPNYAAWLCDDATLSISEAPMEQRDSVLNGIVEEVFRDGSGGTFRGDLVRRNVEVDRGGPFVVLGWLP